MKNSSRGCQYLSPANYFCLSLKKDSICDFVSSKLTLLLTCDGCFPEIQTFSSNDGVCVFPSFLFYQSPVVLPGKDCSFKATKAYNNMFNSS